MTCYSQNEDIIRQLTRIADALEGRRIPARDTLRWIDVSDLTQITIETAGASRLYFELEDGDSEFDDPAETEVLSARFPPLARGGALSSRDAVSEQRKFARSLYSVGLEDQAVQFVHNIENDKRCGLRTSDDNSCHLYAGHNRGVRGSADVPGNHRSLAEIQSGRPMPWEEQ